jgi:hypothetical protein
VGVEVDLFIEIGGGVYVVEVEIRASCRYVDEFVKKVEVV